MGDHPHWAESIESIVGTEDGVESVIANPATGRVLVDYDPSRINVPVEQLLRRAVSVRPVTAGRTTRHGNKTSKLLTSVAASEQVCLACKAAFVSFGPFATVAAFSTAFLLHRVVPDEPRGIRDNKNRTPADEGSLFASEAEAHS